MPYSDALADWFSLMMAQWMLMMSLEPSVVVLINAGLDDESGSVDEANGKKVEPAVQVQSVSILHLISILGLVQLLVQLFGGVIELLQTFALYAGITVRQAMSPALPVCCVGQVRL